MNPFKTGEMAANIAEAIAPETTKLAESTALRLLDAGGTSIPNAGKLEIKTMSVGGEFPGSIPNNFGLKSADVENCLDSRMLQAPADETVGDVLDHSPLSISWGLPATSEWTQPATSEFTPAVKDMMRKAFLKSEG